MKIRCLDDLNKELNNQLIITDDFIEYYNNELKILFARGLISLKELNENYIEE